MICLVSSGVVGDEPMQNKQSIDGENKIRVLFQDNNDGISLWIRHAFSSSHDMMLWAAKDKSANFLMNTVETRLVPITSEMSESTFKKGVLVHANGDDTTPWFINGTFIGGNHGDSSALEILSPGHGCTIADIGSVWKDEAGAVFYLVRIPDKNKIWILSENKGSGVIWKFNVKITGSALTSPNGKVIDIQKFGQTQLRPCCRINRQEFLADGKAALVPGQVVECEYLDIVEDYDIINTGSILADIISNPGKEPDFTSKNLDAVINNHIIYRYYPDGATVISHKAKTLQPFSIRSMGFIQQNLLWTASTPDKSLEYYIPKTCPFTQDGINYNFRAVQDFSKPPSALSFSADAKTVETANNLPDRFIQILGDRKNGSIVRRVGFAMGYSLIHGITIPVERLKYTSSAGFIYVSTKTYPWAIDKAAGNPIPAGTQYECLAYRQYFNPSAFKNATNVYWHKEGDSYLLYADYHKAVENDVINLPDYLSGKKITVIEKTPSVKLLTKDKIPADGLRLSIGKEAYGYIVLKLD